MEQVIEKRIVIHAKGETVYRALTESRALARWFANRAESKPVPGGSLLLMWGAGEQTEGARAVFTRLVPGREITLQWVSKIKPGETIAVSGMHQSTFTISPSPEGVIVAMRYTADPPPADSERMKMDQDWDQALVSLKSLCEGPDAPAGDDAASTRERGSAAASHDETIEAVNVVGTPRRSAARTKAGGKKKTAKTRTKRAKPAKKAKTKSKAKKAARRPAKKSAARKAARRPARKAAKKTSAKRARSSPKKPARKKPAKKR